MMEGYQKYKRQYFLPPEPCMDWAGKEYIQASFVDVPWKVLCSGITGRSHLYESEYAESS